MWSQRLFFFLILGNKWRCFEVERRERKKETEGRIWAFFSSHLLFLINTITNLLCLFYFQARYLIWVLYGTTTGCPVLKLWVLGPQSLYKGDNWIWWILGDFFWTCALLTSPLQLPSNFSPSQSACVASTIFLNTFNSLHLKLFNSSSSTTFGSKILSLEDETRHIIQVSLWSWSYPFFIYI